MSESGSGSYSISGGSDCGVKKTRCRRRKGRGTRLFVEKEYVTLPFGGATGPTGQGIQGLQGNTGQQGLQGLGASRQTVKLMQDFTFTGVQQTIPVGLGVTAVSHNKGYLTAQASGFSTAGPGNIIFVLLRDGIAIGGQRVGLTDLGGGEFGWSLNINTPVDLDVGIPHLFTIGAYQLGGAVAFLLASSAPLRENLTMNIFYD